jgi:hypothetical protein
VSDDDRQRAALTAVSDLVQQLDPGAMVTRFVVLAEVIDADNDRALWSFTAPDATKWDSMGLLQFALRREWNDADED